MGACGYTAARSRDGNPAGADAKPRRLGWGLRPPLAPWPAWLHGPRRGCQRDRLLAGPRMNWGALYVRVRVCCSVRRRRRRRRCQGTPDSRGPCPAWPKAWPGTVVASVRPCGLTGYVPGGAACARGKRAPARAVHPCWGLRCLGLRSYSVQSPLSDLVAEPVRSPPSRFQSHCRKLVVPAPRPR